MRTSSTIFAAALASSLLAACGGKPSPAGGAAETAGGEPSMPAVVVADQAEWDALLAAGKVSFDNACGSCHGDGGYAPALQGEKESVPEMTTQIRQGSGKMKPIGEDRLPETEMKGLLVYLASIDAVSGVKGP
jgi:mono/diheme cytochrome c family protein